MNRKQKVKQKKAKQQKHNEMLRKHMLFKRQKQIEEYIEKMKSNQDVVDIVDTIDVQDDAVVIEPADK